MSLLPSCWTWSFFNRPSPLYFLINSFKFLFQLWNKCLVLLTFHFKFFLNREPHFLKILIGYLFSIINSLLFHKIVYPIRLFFCFGFVHDRAEETDIVAHTFVHVVDGVLHFVHSVFNINYHLRRFLSVLDGNILIADVCLIRRRRWGIIFDAIESIEFFFWSVVEN